jgi:alpha/beta superfamily hydrolase
VSFPLYSSISFDLTVTSMYVPLVSGGTVVVYPDTDIRDFSILDVFDDDRVDVVKMTPSHLALLEPSHFATDRIRTLILGGEDLKSAAAAAAIDSSGGRLTIYNEYGPTEATVGCMIHRYEPGVDTEVSVPIGRPIANTKTYLLDSNRLPVPPGVPGEIFVAGDGVAAGYLGLSELTEDVFLPDPFEPGTMMYRTGDQARWRSSGVIEYLGRTDDQIKLRGHRIEPGEIESVLAEHEAVAAAAVAVREPHPGDFRLVAYYAAQQHAALNDTELREHMGARLPEFMVPHHLVRLDALPVTANGKLDRKALPDAIGDVTRTAQIVPPQTEAELLVARLVEELVGVNGVSMLDNFFDLGGHSVLAMQLIARIHTETGERLSPRVILLNTLQQTAAALSVPPSTDTPEAEIQDASVGDLAGTRTIGTSAIFFGPSEEPLFGIHTSPTGRRIRPHGVLICPPIGWEYMRTHWAIRKLADLLVNQGLHVFRFDYFGTGDSSGSSRDASIGRWVEDVSSAAAELHAFADHVDVVGVRHGATFAALACSAGLTVDRLVLWDPVVGGDDYVTALEAMHAEMLATRRGGPVAVGVVGDELLGFPYPEPLRRELRGLDLRTIPLPHTATFTFVSQARPEYEALAAVAPDAVRYEVVEDVGGWDELASSYSSLLPARLPARIAELLGGDG